MKGFLIIVSTTLLLGILKLTLLPLLSWWLVSLPALLYGGFLTFVIVIFLITYIVMLAISFINKHQEK